MSADASIDLQWGDGEHKFRLRIGELRELQEKVNKPRVTAGVPAVGPAEVVALLGTGGWWVDDVRETIRLGLIGGGMAPVSASAMVARYIDLMPLAENVLVARAVLVTSLVGVPDDPVGKEEAGETTTGETPSSSSPHSTEPAPRSAGRRSKSTPAPSGSSPLQSTASTEPTTQTT